MNEPIIKEDLCDACLQPGGVLPYKLSLLCQPCYEAASGEKFFPLTSSQKYADAVVDALASALRVKNILENLLRTPPRPIGDEVIGDLRGTTFELDDLADILSGWTTNNKEIKR